MYSANVTSTCTIKNTSSPLFLVICIEKGQKTFSTIIIPYIVATQNTSMNREAIYTQINCKKHTVHPHNDHNNDQRSVNKYFCYLSIKCSNDLRSFLFFPLVQSVIDEHLKNCMMKAADGEMD